jgi:hypothetical protein
LADGDRCHVGRIIKRPVRLRHFVTVAGDVNAQVP